MPVVLTALGTTLDVTVVDENFETLQDLFRSALLRADFNTPFSRFVVRRYTGGRLVSATVLAGQLLLKDAAHLGQYDFIARYGTLKNPSLLAADLSGSLVWGGTSAFNDSRDWNTVAMELLGKPGPSFYYQWQEDGLDEAVVLAGVAGWPPTYWPANRYPSNVCYSSFLTVPGASLKVYTEEPCVARVSGTALGALNFSPVGILSAQVLAGVGDTYRHFAVDNFLHWREAYRYRLGLVVDTNPKLYSDEFSNTNLNIVDPYTGAQATRKTWNIINDRTFYASQRQEFKLTGEQELKGRRYYNFSMKYRDGNIRGFVYNDPAAGGARTWDPGAWGLRDLWGGLPTPDPNWAAEFDVLFPGATPAGPGATRNYWPYTPYVNLWDGAALHVEFLYGRSTAYRIDSEDLEFTSKPA